MMIRAERQADHDAVREVVGSAFATAEHSDGDEHDLVDALRESEAHVPELSLVCEVDGEIVGHIMFTDLHVGEHVALALAPLSVAPAWQRRGIGTSLIREDAGSLESSGTVTRSCWVATSTTHASVTCRPRRWGFSRASTSRARTSWPAGFAKTPRQYRAQSGMRRNSVSTDASKAWWEGGDHAVVRFCDDRLAYAARGKSMMQYSMTDDRLSPITTISAPLIAFTSRRNARTSRLRLSFSCTSRS